MKKFYPEIQKEAYVICNEMADLSNHIELGDFRIKTNDFTNLEPIELIKNFIKKNDIKDKVLFSASLFQI